jgi:hypothetical protein
MKEELSATSATRDPRWRCPSQEEGVPTGMKEVLSATSATSGK